MWSIAILPAFADDYFPTRFEWQTRTPEQAGFDSARLQQAIDHAVTSENPQPKEISKVLPMSIGNEPFDAIIGPVKDRGPLNGIILRDGYIVAEWGDTERVDMTFSVTKSYVSTMAGLALADGLIRDLQDPVRMYIKDGDFDSEHNAKITWHMMLNQTSWWEGTLWDKPDWADRWDGEEQKSVEPGSAWEYNDVRVNRLAYALLQIWRRPLPQILRERIMDPIGASYSWQWHGYENSWVTIDGLQMQSVSGGGHWGGGMHISTRDHARFGYLFLRRGKWDGKQLLPERWIDRVTTPTDVRPTYGYMNWEPNTDQQLYPSAPANNFFAHGAGTNVIWIDPEHEIVSVVRWIEGGAIDEYIRLVLAALE